MNTSPRTLDEYRKTIDQLHGLANRTNERLRRIEKRSEVLEEICEAIQGLKRTEEEFLIHEGKKPNPYPSWHYYPGKNSTAYYYAEEVTDKDIKSAHDFKPHIYRECPNCHQERPVIVSYAQTYDSPQLDIWTTKAVIICCDQIRVIKTDDYRT